jgi:hypothetical protein
MMNDELKRQAKARIDAALKQTQSQTEEVAADLGGLFRVGVQKLREAADKAKDAIQRDINSRP